LNYTRRASLLAFTQ